ncbi:NAD(P)H-quinone oxidoreductase subunit O, chloroplastic [Telopea speciosissima]|uniref:NAD(P)H-quinone oxidoreductase subunit O, chloroplastic n=1 Tax=Telopea speciosissima TaxID=54955 RepID=UPI001CC7745B|nr:NAD(P)H-quinone oxidoreductase subunit O, chloroplastic [Telopea speciosissima]
MPLHPSTLYPMAFYSAILPHNSYSCLSPIPQTLRRNPCIRGVTVRATNAAAGPGKENGTQATATNEEPSKTPSPTTTTTTTKTNKLPKKPVYSMKKGQIVRVDKEKYLDSVNYLSVGHPLYYKGLDYIYEDRGEVLDIRIFETGEYALIAWVGIPTAPAWLPTDMLIKSNTLNYERM